MILFFNLCHNFIAWLHLQYDNDNDIEWDWEQKNAILLSRLKLMSSSSLHFFFKSVDKVAANWKRMFIKWVTNRRLFFIVQLDGCCLNIRSIYMERTCHASTTLVTKKAFLWMKKRQKRILKPQHKKANATKQHHKLYLFISLPTCLSLALFLRRLSTPIIIIIVTTEYTFQWGLSQGMINFHEFLLT